jgi:hypothetical protein
MYLSLYISYIAVFISQPDENTRNELDLPGVFLPVPFDLLDILELVRCIKINLTSYMLDRILFVIYER